MGDRVKWRREIESETGRQLYRVTWRRKTGTRVTLIRETARKGDMETGDRQ